MTNIRYIMNAGICYARQQKIINNEKSPEKKIVRYPCSLDDQIIVTWIHHHPVEHRNMWWLQWHLTSIVKGEPQQEHGSFYIYTEKKQAFITLQVTIAPQPM
jgi:hypothetical protein